MSAIPEILMEYVFSFLIALLWWFLLFPVVWLASVPFILISALFSRESYGTTVFNRFLSVHHFWKEWGMMLVP
jgi:hypothetical protein